MLSISETPTGSGIQRDDSNDAVTCRDHFYLFESVPGITRAAA
jgi:hypothetical protein